MTMTLDQAKKMLADPKCATRGGVLPEGPCSEAATVVILGKYSDPMVLLQELASNLLRFAQAEVDLGVAPEGSMERQNSDMLVSLFSGQVAEMFAMLAKKRALTASEKAWKSRAEQLSRSGAVDRAKTFQLASEISGEPVPTAPSGGSLRDRANTAMWVWGGVILLGGIWWYSSRRKGKR